MDPAIVEKLQEFGLSEKEAKVYFASLELGSATADQISKQAGVNRSTTYVQIEQLMKLGLMSTHEEGKKTFFSAESPAHLSRLFKKQIEALEVQSVALEKFVPELNRVFENAGQRPMVRFFEGKEGYVTMRNEVLKSKVKEYYVAVNFDLMASVLTEEERDEFSRVRSEKNIGGKVIYTKTGEDVVPVPPIRMKRISEADFPFQESELYIYGSHVAVASLKGTVAGVIIESPAIANSMRVMFDLAWQSPEAREITTD